MTIQKMMMLVCLALWSLTSSAAEAPDKTVVTRTYDVAAIKELKATTGIVVNYTQSANVKVTVTAPRDMFDYIKVDISGRNLQIGFTNNILKKLTDAERKKVKVEVSAPDVRSFDVSTSGVILCQKPLVYAEGAEVDIEASTSGVINVGTINCSELSLDATTSGVINVKAATVKRDFELDATTSGVINAKGTTGDLSASASTSGVINMRGTTFSGEGDLKATTGGVINFGIANSRASVKKSTGGVIN